MEVHKALGPGFLESVYEEALKVELGFQGINFESQKQFPITYRGQEIKQFSCDLVVENKIILELKALKQLGDIERAQVINYLKVTGLQLGILMNFGEKSLVSERLVSTTQNKN
ncbi:MAG: GxxExxY protein [Candidatus Marinimicrobia bacterium]|nr:GxxExxY protein [Candidatus Neomarinimicrobiota bacterium]